MKNKHVPSLGLTIGLLVILSLLVALTGCGGSSSATPTPSTSSSSTPASSPAASGDVYKIGAVFSVTGFNSPLGSAEKDAAKLFEEQINAKGGINGKKVQVIIYDTESDETKAVSLAKKLIDQDKVLAIVGPSATGESLALVDIVNKAGVPLVSCAASAQIVNPVTSYVFKTPQSDALAVAELFDYAKKNGWTKLALLSSSGGFGTTGKAALEAAAPQAGIKLVAAETFGDTDLDMTAQITRIKGTDAQALVVWGTNPGPAIIAKNMKQLNMTIPLLQSHGVANAKFLELAGEAANGVVLPGGTLMVYQSLADSDPQKKVLSDFATSFSAKYGREADSFGGYAWDALGLVTRAIEKAGADKAKLRDELEATKGYVGVTGAFNMSATDHNGLGKGSFVMIRVAGGKWTKEQ